MLFLLGRRPEGGDGLGLGGAAFGAGVGAHALLRRGGLGSHGALVPCVVGRRDLARLDGPADIACQLLLPGRGAGRGGRDLPSTFVRVAVDGMELNGVHADLLTPLRIALRLGPLVADDAAVENGRRMDGRDGFGDPDILEAVALVEELVGDLGHALLDMHVLKAGAAVELRVAAAAPCGTGGNGHRGELLAVDEDIGMPVDVCGQLDLGESRILERAVPHALQPIVQMDLGEARVVRECGDPDGLHRGGQRHLMQVAVLDATVRGERGAGDFRDALGNLDLCDLRGVLRPVICGCRGDVRRQREHAVVERPAVAADFLGIGAARAGQQCYAQGEHAREGQHPSFPCR